MAASMFDFGGARQKFCGGVRISLEVGTLDEIQNCFSQTVGSDGEKKMTLDQSFRDNMKTLVAKSSDCRRFTSLVDLAVEAVSQEFCSPSIPFILLSDVFDSVTLDICDSVFQFVEEKVSLWKNETYYTAGKNYLLRMCNDLLRRLSQSQNTVFCGRIQLFLARLFPLSEKSGLNIMSQFNIENLTAYNTKPEEYKQARQSVDGEKDDSMEIEEGEMDERSPSIPIDYNLYKKFWSLQDYFRKPNQCYDKVAWKMFASNSDEVLAVFQSFKLDDPKFKKKLPGQEQSHAYFAKYLTSEKLLDLQLADSCFRRYVLVQFLILYQYLNATVKFKSASYVLTDDQSQWVKSTTEKIYQLIRETPPDGDKFSSAIEHALVREENWNNWKNDGCRSYVKDKTQEPVKEPTVKRKRSFGDDLKLCGGKLIKMGSAELTRLWNICPHNMEACAAENRIFLPQLESYFEEAIEQLDPEAMVDDEYKLINDKNFSWKGLRLMARRSPHFFTQTNQPGKKLTKYLEEMLGKVKVAKDTVLEPGQDEMKADEAEADEEEQIKEDQAREEELQAEEQGTNGEAVDLVTDELLQSLAVALKAEWKKLATELNFGEDDVTDFEGDSSSLAEQAMKMLSTWKENESHRATVGSLQNALREIGQVNISTQVFGEKKNV